MLVKKINMIFVLSLILKQFLKQFLKKIITCKNTYYLNVYNISFHKPKAQKCFFVPLYKKLP